MTFEKGSEISKHGLEGFDELSYNARQSGQAKLLFIDVVYVEW